MTFRLNKKTKFVLFIGFVLCMLPILGGLIWWSWQSDVRIVCATTSDPQKIEACETLEVPTFKEFK